MFVFSWKRFRRDVGRPRAERKLSTLEVAADLGNKRQAGINLSPSPFPKSVLHQWNLAIRSHDYKNKLFPFLRGHRTTSSVVPEKHLQFCMPNFTGQEHSSIWGGVKRAHTWAGVFSALEKSTNGFGGLLGYLNDRESLDTSN